MCPCQDTYLIPLTFGTSVRLGIVLYDICMLLAFLHTDNQIQANVPVHLRVAVLKTADIIINVILFGIEIIWQALHAGQNRASATNWGVIRTFPINPQH